MGRHPTSSSFITPIAADGSLAEPLPSAFVGKGAYRVVADGASATYYFPVGGQDCTELSVHLQHDELAMITAAVLEVTNFPPSAVDDHEDAIGAWVPVTADIAVAGQSTTVTDGVVVASGDPGGAVWNLTGGARRARLKVTFADGTDTGVRVAAWGKE